MLSCTNTTVGLSQPTFDVMEVHISVDYCVSVCRAVGAPYSVLQVRRRNEMSTYLVIIQTEQVHFFPPFILYQKKTQKNPNKLLCKLCKYLQIVIERVRFPGLIFIVYYVKSHYRKHFVNQFWLYFLHTALGAVL